MSSQMPTPIFSKTVVLAKMAGISSYLGKKHKISERAEMCDVYALPKSAAIPLGRWLALDVVRRGIIQRAVASATGRLTKKAFTFFCEEKAEKLRQKCKDDYDVQFDWSKGGTQVDGKTPGLRLQYGMWLQYMEMARWVETGEITDTYYTREIL